MRGRISVEEWSALLKGGTGNLIVVVGPSKRRPHENKSSVTRTRQHWTSQVGQLVKRQLSPSVTVFDNDIGLMHVQPHHFRMRQVEPRHQLGEISKCSLWAIELLSPCLNNINRIPDSLPKPYTTILMFPMCLFSCKFLYMYQITRCKILRLRLVYSTNIKFNLNKEQDK